MEDNTPKIGQIKVSDLTANVKLVNNKLHFQGKAGDNAIIDTDYTPPLGDNLGHTPLELFLISFATCAGGSILALLRRMKKTITGLEISATGVRRDQHPTSFSKITLHLILKSSDTSNAELDKAINMSEETYCPVWAMIKNNVEVVTEYKIIQ